MTESKVEYNAGGKVTPDNVGAAMRQITENYIAQLERTIDGYNMIQHRHAEMIAERDARIAELEADIARKNGALHACDQTIAALEARLATIPLASMERHIMGIDSAADYHEIVAYFFPQEATA